MEKTVIIMIEWISATFTKTFEINTGLNEFNLMTEISNVIEKHNIPKK